MEGRGEKRVKEREKEGNKDGTEERRRKNSRTETHTDKERFLLIPLIKLFYVYFFVLNISNKSK